MPIPVFDPVQYKAGQRRQWGESAVGWQQLQRSFEQAAQHVNVRLVELADIHPGQRVLDIATGLGQPAITAARHVGPTGHVVATDLSPEMLALARQNAAALGLQQIDFREMDAEAPDLPEQSFHAILCRWGLMFLPNVTTALTRLRRLLFPGGRCAAAVWGPPERVPFSSLPARVLRQVLQPPPPPAGTPDVFSLADRGVLEHTFRQAGFTQIHTESLTVTFTYASVDDFIAERRAVSPNVRALLANASAAERTTIHGAIVEAVTPYTGADGVIQMPNETLCIVGQ
jgi:ubiquinone/menaquinone biosynthesis C-methylase UbiE